MGKIAEKSNRKRKAKPEDAVDTPQVAPAKRLSKRLSIPRKTWTDEELLAELKYLDRKTSANIVHLFDDGNTIPFMCRYRRELIGNLSADE